MGANSVTEYRVYSPFLTNEANVVCDVSLTLLEHRIRQKGAIAPIVNTRKGLKFCLMKTTWFLKTVATLALTAGAFQASGQPASLYQIVINGVSWRTNNQGAIVQQPLNNGTILKDLARINNTTDYSNWGS